MLVYQRNIAARLKVKHEFAPELHDICKHTIRLISLFSAVFANIDREKHFHTVEGLQITSDHSGLIKKTIYFSRCLSKEQTYVDPLIDLRSISSNTQMNLHIDFIWSDELT